LGSGLPATSGNFLSGFSGAYLAGRHAASQSNVDEAGSYFAKALARDPGNPALMEQTIIYQSAQGGLKPQCRLRGICLNLMKVIARRT